MLVPLHTENHIITLLLCQSSYLKKKKKSIIWQISVQFKTQNSASFMYINNCKVQRGAALYNTARQSVKMSATIYHHHVYLNQWLMFRCKCSLQKADFPMKSHQEPLSVVQSSISCSACETECKVHMRQVEQPG